MLIVALIFLGLAVLFGGIILNSILKNKRTPKPMVMLHGSVGLFAILVLVGYIVAGHYSPLLISSLILFLVAAIGGVTLFVFDIKRKNLPLPIVLCHPLIAISGVITLLVYLVQQSSMS